MPLGVRRLQQGDAAMQQSGSFFPGACRDRPEIPAHPRRSRPRRGGSSHEPFSKSKDRLFSTDTISLSRSARAICVSPAGSKRVNPACSRKRSGPATRCSGSTYTKPYEASGCPAKFSRTARTCRTAMDSCCSISMCRQTGRWKKRDGKSGVPNPSTRRFDGEATLKKGKIWPLFGKKPTRLI